MNATKTCTGNSACDGNGSCALLNGKSCTKDADCITSLCVDGVCCNDACTDQCKSCDVKNKEGTCSYVPAGQPDSSGTKTCTGKQSCDGKGNCKSASGETCIKPDDCGSGYCMDGYCCKTSCTENCMSCGLLGTEGICSPHPANSDPDKDCIGTDPDCKGKCDGAGGCNYPGIGTLCDNSKACLACDGAGKCDQMPQDDPDCGDKGIIDCDQLDTTCKDFEDLKTNVCSTAGECKKPNDPQTCKVFNTDFRAARST